MSTIINPSIIDLGNGYRWYHRLLPDSNFYDLTVDTSGVTPPNAPPEIDITYADLDPGTVSDHLQIVKASMTIRGPQGFNQGEAFLIIEDVTQTGNYIWTPFFSLVDGQYRATDSWNPGIKMTNAQIVCWTYMHRPYGGFNPSGCYGSALYRSMWVDIFYHIG